jgi:hypothetical protein
MRGKTRVTTPMPPHSQPGHGATSFPAFRQLLIFWLDARNAYDHWHAERGHQNELEAVVSLKAV